jgi:predicted nucleic acid-binding protein
VTAISALAGASLYFDSNIFINALESPERAIRKRLDALFQAVFAKRCAAGCSVLTRAEVLVHPLRENQVQTADAYRELLAAGGRFAIYPLDEPVVDRAARLRADYPALRLPDALHVATSIQNNCSAFVTADKRLGDVSARIPIILLDQLAAD